MTVQGHRSERIAEEIRNEVSLMLAGELKDPRLAAPVMVTEVRLGAGMRTVRVFVSLAGDASGARDDAGRVAGRERLRSARIGRALAHAARAGSAVSFSTKRKNTASASRTCCARRKIPRSTFRGAYRVAADKRKQKDDRIVIAMRDAI